VKQREFNKFLRNFQANITRFLLKSSVTFNSWMREKEMPEDEEWPPIGPPEDPKTEHISDPPSPPPPIPIKVPDDFPEGIWWD
jgi:hypothetical protein